MLVWVTASEHAPGNPPFLSTLVWSCDMRPDDERAAFVEGFCFGMALAFLCMAAIAAFFLAVFP